MSEAGHNRISFALLRAANISNSGIMREFQGRQKRHFNAKTPRPQRDAKNRSAPDQSRLPLSLCVSLRPSRLCVKLPFLFPSVAAEPRWVSTSSRSGQRSAQRGDSRPDCAMLRSQGRTPQESERRGRGEKTRRARRILTVKEIGRSPHDFKRPISFAPAGSSFPGRCLLRCHSLNISVSLRGFAPLPSDCLFSVAAEPRWAEMHFCRPWNSHDARI